MNQLPLPIHTVYLGLGTNLGDRHAHLKEAIRQIGERIGNVIATSSVLETQPWRFESPHVFLNMAMGVTTRLTPRMVLFITQSIEREMGRMEKSSHAYQDRIIDIDMITYDSLVIQTEELRIPHPRYRERDFVRLPLSEIAPELFED